MSRGTQDQRAHALAELARELRQFTGLGASFFRAAAARGNMTINDLQVIDILDSTGPTTAGQLADLTGLTTGAITGMLNRLEEAALVRRERDPEDGRRVIVRLAADAEQLRVIGAMFATLGESWQNIASSYDDEHIAFLLDFLKRGNALTQQEIVRLREAPASAGDISSAPLGDLEQGRLGVFSATSRLTIRAASALAELYQARFDGVAPEVKVKDGEVTIRYPRRLWMPGREQRAAEVTLNATIPWRIEIQGGASDVTAELGGLDLASLDVKGGLNSSRFELGVPSGVVPIRISGGASHVTIHRPAGVAARVHLKGWASTFVFDEQTFPYVGNDVRLQSSGYEPSAPSYDFEINSSVSLVTISAG